MARLTSVLNSGFSVRVLYHLPYNCDKGIWSEMANLHRDVSIRPGPRTLHLRQQNTQNPCISRRSAYGKIMYQES